MPVWSQNPLVMISRVAMVIGPLGIPMKQASRLSSCREVSSWSQCNMISCSISHCHFWGLEVKIVDTSRYKARVHDDIIISCTISSCTLSTGHGWVLGNILGRRHLCHHVSQLQYSYNLLLPQGHVKPISQVLTQTVKLMFHKPHK